MIQLHLDCAVDPAKEQDMLKYFANVFRPAAAKFPGFIDVKMLKLDGSFVRDLMSNPRSESLVRGIAQLGHGMDIETVAECVETFEVRDRLADVGVDCAQGFLFGRPRPFDGILAQELGVPVTVIAGKPVGAEPTPSAVPDAAAIAAKG